MMAGGIPERIGLVVSRKGGWTASVTVRVNPMAPPTDLAPPPPKDDAEAWEGDARPLTSRSVASLPAFKKYLADVTGDLATGQSILVDALTPQARKMLALLKVTPPVPKQIPVSIDG